MSRKQTTPNFPKNEHVLPPEGKKCLLIRKFGVLCFLVTFDLRSPFCLFTDEICLKQKAASFHKNGFFKTWFYERAPLNLVF